MAAQHLSKDVKSTAVAQAATAGQQSSSSIPAANKSALAAVLGAELANVKSEDSTLSNVGTDKKFKTLTRTRQFVNEEGQTVTVSTQRVVETALASGRAMTIRKGMENAEQDWQMAEQKKMALLRKDQLRETKIMQREEQRECAELLSKMKREREAYVGTSLSAIVFVRFILYTLCSAP